VTLEQVVDLQNERLHRLQHSDKARGYLCHLATALDTLAELVRHNGDGRYTYAMQTLVAYVDRLRSEALHHTEGAQGNDADDIPF
jgi:hypothetical protein